MEVAITSRPLTEMQCRNDITYTPQLTSLQQLYRAKA